MVCCIVNKTMVDIRPPHCLEFRHKQAPGNNPAIAPLPSNQLLVAPANSGKTVLLNQMLLNKNLYRGCFQRIYVFSHSGPDGAKPALDRAWDDVQEYSAKVLHVDQKREKTFFNTMDEAALKSILDQWLLIGDAIKSRIEKRGMRNEVKGAVIILDDYIDSHRFARTSPVIEALAARSRHCFLSVFFSVQSYRAVAPLVRRNVRVIYVFRLRNSACYLAPQEEVAAVAGKEGFKLVYDAAVDEDHSFLTIRLDQPHDMFFRKFGERLKLQDSQPAGRPAPQS